MIGLWAYVIALLQVIPKIFKHVNSNGNCDGFKGPCIIRLKKEISVGKNVAFMGGCVEVEVTTHRKSSPNIFSFSV